jgi:hypothetical protein
MKIISIHVGLSTIGLPYNETNLHFAAQLLATPFFSEEYATTESGDYSRVWCKRSSNPTMSIIEDAEVFNGTLKEYRERPKTYADLVADLSVANDKIKELEAAPRIYAEAAE